MTNFIYPRRLLQDLIKDSSGFLSETQRGALVGRLNRAGDDRLPAMWELVVLHALASVGSVKHEIGLTTGARPDFQLTPREPIGHGFESIVGDITTVSDSGLHERNPVRELGDELTRLARKAGLDPNKFSYDVRGDRDGPYNDSRIKLFLPEKAELLAIMKANIAPWILTLRQAPELPSKVSYAKDGIAFQVGYDPSQRYASGSHLSYDVAASRDKNPLFTALKKKAQQLKAAPPGSLRLIVVCDGGCALLTRRHQSHGTFSARQVAEDFLRQNTSVDAVLLVAIDSPLPSFGARQTCRNSFHLITPRQQRLPKQVLERIEQLLNAVVAKFPKPVQTAVNAANRCREPGPGPDLIGGQTVSATKISLSSRALQRLLVGGISQADFAEIQGWNDSMGGNPFSRMQKDGRTIVSVEIEAVPDRDDDWITFRFGALDPACGDFTPK